MLRLGVSLPALMQLLGHKDIYMTLLYLDVTQQDLQREFYSARQKAASPHPIPKLPLPQATTPERVNLLAIRNAIAVVRHLLQLFRMELQDPNARRKLRRLSNASSRSVMFLITSPKNECTLASQLMEGLGRTYGRKFGKEFAIRRSGRILPISPAVHYQVPMRTTACVDIFKPSCGWI
jgi:hypothetical protein